MAELEQRLAGLGAALTFPAPTRSSTTSWPRSLAAGDAAGGDRCSSLPPCCSWSPSLVAAVPDTRHAVARWLGFESLRIEVVERIPPDLVPDDCSAGRS